MRVVNVKEMNLGGSSGDEGHRIIYLVDPD